jgi:tripartite-type tricarboxylate transporter receptor subunit TctC
MSRFAGLIGCMAVASVALWPPSSPAQEAYPSRTVKIVVPAVAGSTTDTLARVVADQLSQKWGKATIVENIPGGAMNIAALGVARAAPDGYTLLVAPPSPLSFNHTSIARPATSRASSSRSPCWRKSRTSSSFARTSRRPRCRS